MSTVTISRPGHIAKVVAAFLGFEPSNSLVITAMGAGPTARVDLGPLAVASLEPAVQYWSDVLLVVYSDDERDVVEVTRQFTKRYPKVNILVSALVHDGMVYVGDGPGDPVADTGSELDAVRVVSSRAELVAEAAEVEDAEEAWMMAWESYMAGSGARSWAYLDRYVELAGADDRAQDLSRRLTDAVEPPR